MRDQMPIPSRKRSLELGASFIENDLHKMRAQAREQYETAYDRSRKPCPRGCTPGNAVNPASEGVPSPCTTCHGTAYVHDFDGREFPLGSSHEGDLMKAVEWATAAATLRMLAEREDG